MKRILKYVVFALTIIGALNWGIVGLFDFEIISYYLGESTLLCRIIYTIIGLSAIFTATFAMIDCKKCNNDYYENQ